MTLSGASTTTTYSYNEQNRLKSIVTPLAGGKEERVYYYYDNNGNLVTKTKETINPVNTNDVPGIEVFSSGPNPTGDITLYKYNNWNQLVETIDKGVITAYKYNGDGLRVEKTANSTLTRYMYEYDKVVLEVDGSGTQKARNVYGLNLLCRTAGSDTLYYMYNGHGDVTALINAAGTIAASYYYDAFGNILSQTGSVNNNITYAGYQYDSETELYYLNARYYDSKIARFLSEDTYTGDPNDPLSLNLYTYCANNPIIYLDSTGHVWMYNAGGILQDIDSKDVSGATQVGYTLATGNVTMYNSGGLSGQVSVTDIERAQQVGFTLPQVIYSNTDTVNINSGGIINLSDIKTLNVGSNGVVSIDNRGYINGIYTGANSSTSINNSGHIGVISSGTESKTNIENIGYIGIFNTGAKSTNEVASNSFIGMVYTGLDNTTVISGKGYTAYAGGNGKITITGVLNTVQLAAINDAKSHLNAILEKYRYNKWPNTGYYQIEDYTWGAEYYDKYLKELNRVKDFTSIFNIFDLLSDISDTFEKLSSTNVKNPYILAVSSVLIGTLKNRVDGDEPGIAELPDAFGITGWLTNNIAEAKEKSDYINNNIYKYLIWDGGILWSKGRRGVFIDEVDKLKSDIANKSFNIYESDADNILYKTTIQNYLQSVINLNNNYKLSKSAMENDLNDIADKYK